MTKQFLALSRNAAVPPEIRLSQMTEVGAGQPDQSYARTRFGFVVERRFSGAVNQSVMPFTTM